MLRRAFDARFWGHVTTVRAALPYLAPAGSITPLGAITARAAMPGTAGIAAINGAVEALVKPSRRTRAHPGQRRLTRLGRHPLVGRPARGRQAVVLHPGCSATAWARRIATADDIADAVVLAATNPNLTGTIIETDGGAPLVPMS